MVCTHPPVPESLEGMGVVGLVEEGVIGDGEPRHFVELPGGPPVKRLLQPDVTWGELVPCTRTHRGVHDAIHHVINVRRVIGAKAR